MAVDSIMTQQMGLWRAVKAASGWFVQGGPRAEAPGALGEKETERRQVTLPLSSVVDPIGRISSS